MLAVTIILCLPAAFCGERGGLQTAFITEESVGRNNVSKHNGQSRAFHTEIMTRANSGTRFIHPKPRQQIGSRL